MVFRFIKWCVKVFYPKTHVEGVVNLPDEPVIIVGNHCQMNGPPTRQDLRPAEFANDNFLTQCIAFIYSVDTNTGVCPSLHVAYSLGIASVWTKEKGAHPAWKAFVVFAVVMICLSTMFIKQHSAVGFFAAIPVCLIAEGFVYRDRYFKKR